MVLGILILRVHISKLLPTVELAIFTVELVVELLASVSSVGFIDEIAVLAMHVRFGNGIEISKGTILLFTEVKKNVQFADSASVNSAYIVVFVTSTVNKNDGQLLVVAVCTVVDVELGIFDVLSDDVV